MCAKKSLAVKVKKKHGEQVRLLLLKKDLLRSDLKIKRNKDYLFIPVKDTTETINDFTLVTTVFQKTKQKTTQYQELLDLPKELQALLPTSFDVIGDILLIKLPEELTPFSNKIGTALLKTHSHVNTVCQMNPVTGELRKRSIKVIAGKQKTETVHKEYGLYYNVDVEKTYFSPRLATERKRVCKLIQPKSTVFDMFCGVAPFSIMIAKYAKPDHILCIDKNPEAIQFAKQNISKNKVKEKITVLHDDAKNTKKILEKHHMIPDHVIMNLPFSAFEFFPTAIQCIADQGLIHYYDILEESFIHTRIDQLQQTAQQYNTQLSIDEDNVHKIKTYAPHEFYIGIDITVSKK